MTSTINTYIQTQKREGKTITLFQIPAIGELHTYLNGFIGEQEPKDVMLLPVVGGILAYVPSQNDSTYFDHSIFLAKQEAKALGNIYVNEPRERKTLGDFESAKMIGMNDTIKQLLCKIIFQVLELRALLTAFFRQSIQPERSQIHAYLNADTVGLNRGLKFITSIWLLNLPALEMVPMSAFVLQFIYSFQNAQALCLGQGFRDADVEALKVMNLNNLPILLDSLFTINGAGEGYFILKNVRFFNTNTFIGVFDGCATRLIVPRSNPHFTTLEVTDVLVDQELVKAKLILDGLTV